MCKGKYKKTEAPHCIEDIKGKYLNAYEAPKQYRAS